MNNEVRGYFEANKEVSISQCWDRNKITILKTWNQNVWTNNGGEINTSELIQSEERKWFLFIPFKRIRIVQGDYSLRLLSNFRKSVGEVQHWSFITKYPCGPKSYRHCNSSWETVVPCSMISWQTNLSQTGPVSSNISKTLKHFFPKPISYVFFMYPFWVHVTMKYIE